MDSNTELTTKYHSSENDISLKTKDSKSSYESSVGKQIKRPLSPSGIKVTKRPMTHVKEQYLSSLDKGSPYTTSSYYIPSKYVSSTTSTTNSSVRAPIQKDYSKELNKNSKYPYSLSVNTSHPPISSPSYHEYHNHSNESLMYSKQRLDDSSQTLVADPQKNISVSTSSSSTNQNNANNNKGSNDAMSNSINSLLLDSLPSSLGVSSIETNDDSKPSQGCLPTPCSSINSTPTNKQCNDQNEQDDANFKEMINKVSTLSDNTNLDGQEAFITNNSNEVSINNNVSVVSNLNSKTRSINNSYPISMITPESSTLSDGKQEKSTNGIPTSNEDQFNVSYSSSRHQSIYSSEVNDMSNSSLATLPNSVSNLSRYPSNNNNPVVSQSQDFRSSYINGSSGSSVNILVNESNNTTSDVSVNNSTNLQEISSFVSSKSSNETTLNEVIYNENSNKSTSNTVEVPIKNESVTIQNNNQNEVRDSRTYIKSPVVIQENYNQYTQIQSINGDNNNQDTVINQNYIDNQYNNTKENVNYISQQPNNISTIQLNNSNNQQQFLGNHQPVSNAYENRQQNSLTFENEVNNETTFSQKQYQINTNNENTQVITEGNVNPKTSFNVNDSSYNNSSHNQNISQNNNNNNRGLPQSNIYTSNNGNSNFNSSEINNGYNQNSVNLPSQYSTTEIPYFFNENNQNQQNNSINTTPQGNYQQQQSSSSLQESVDTPQENYELYKTPYTTIPQSFNSDQPYITINDESLMKRMKKDISQEPKLILIPWEDKKTFVFQLKIGNRTLSRRIDNHTVNGTKLLNIGGLTRGRRDGILKNEKERNVIKHGPLNLKGVWIPLSRARLITEKHKITPEINIILEDDPSKYLKKESQLELKGKYEPYMRIKDRYADDDYIADKYSGVMNQYFQNTMPSDPYLTEYINNNTLNQNNLTELRTEEMGPTSNTLNQSISQHNVPQNIQQGIPQNISQNLQQSIPQNIQQNISQNLQQNISQNLQQGIPQNLPQNIQQNIPQNIQQNLQQNIQQNIQQGIPQNIPQNIQQNIPQNITQNIPQNIQQNIPQNLQQNIQQNIQQGIPQNIQNIRQNLQNIPRNISQNISHNIPSTLSQNIPQSNNYMNPCDLGYIIHSSEKGFTYNGNEQTYYNQSQNERFQQDVRYDHQVQYFNINKSLKKNNQPQQQSINQFSSVPTQLPANSYTNIYDNSNVNQAIQYSSPLTKQIHNSPYNNLSDYSPNPNTPSIIYQNYPNWIDNNNISINNRNGTKFNNEGITQINNTEYNGFSSNNINY